MKTFIIQAFALVAVILLGIYLSFNSSFLSSYLEPLGSKPTGTTQKNPVTSKVKVGNVVLNVEVANTNEKRAKGLSGINSIPKDYGMLFEFSETEKHTFWMKGVKFPLDFIWIRDNIVVDITPNVQPPAVGQSDELLPKYQSKEAVNKVLEVAGGTVAATGIKIGDKLDTR